MIDPQTIGMMIGIVKSIPDTAASRAEAAAEAAAESAEAAATHNMGVSISGTSIVFTSGGGE